MCNEEVNNNKSEMEHGRQYKETQNRREKEKEEKEVIEKKNRRQNFSLHYSDQAANNISRCKKLLFSKNLIFTCNSAR